MNTSKIGNLGIFTLLLVYFFSAQHTFAASGSKAGNKKETTYAALSYSQKTGSYGYATNEKSKRSAIRVAKSACRKHARDCSTKNTGWTRLACISIATDPGGGWGISSGSSRRKARKKAIKNCSRYKGNTACKTLFSVCQ